MTSLEYPYTNFQKSSVTFKKCKNCRKDCQLLYDSHHDLHFSYTCGRVILQSNKYEIEYNSDPLFWEKRIQQKRELQEKRKIIHKLKELKINYHPNTDMTIGVIFKNEQEYDEIAYLCEKASFLIITKYTDTGGRTDIIIPESKKGEYFK